MAVHCIITGRVQGVWYRAWTEKEASALGLSGWVRNLPDGSVEALFSGPEAVVREMIGRCRSGPPLANVDGIAETPAALPEEQGFTIRD
ncbi:acylphosphatase [Hwanghaeella sp.]|uniref:acylphosphatase n=1 Tax=Hwanghaeella sp. TaxID=2605943 RepID=UPI003CCC278E